MAIPLLEAISIEGKTISADAQGEFVPSREYPLNLSPA
jgi:hypothetical protein